MIDVLERIDVTPGQIVLLVIAVFALRAFLRGIARLLIGMVGLAFAAWVGFSVFAHGNEWLALVFGGEPSAKNILYAAWGAGLVTYITLGSIGRATANRLAGDGKTLGPARLVGAGLSLVPSLFLVWVAYTALRASGVITEFESTDRLAAAADGEEVAAGGIFTRAMHAIDQSRIGGFLRSLDPFAPGETAKLTHLLLLAKDSDAWRQLHDVPGLAAVLEQPAVDRLLRDNDVRSLVAHSDYAALLRRPELAEAAADPGVRSALSRIGAGAIEAALTYPSTTGSTTSAAGGEPTVEGVPVSQIPKARVVRTRRRPQGATGSN